MGNKQSNCLVKARAPYDPLLWNSDDVENIANAYKESVSPDGPVIAEDMVKVLVDLDNAVIFQYGDGRVFGSRDVCEKFAGLMVDSGNENEGGGSLDHEQFVQCVKLVLVLIQVLASDPQRIAEVRKNPFNGIMMMEQIAIAAALQEAEEMEQEAEEAEKSGTPVGTDKREMLEV
jgi:hypothetical protein